MREIRVLTLPFDPDTGGFDQAALDDHLPGRKVLRSEPRFFVFEGRPYWSVFVETRTLQNTELRPSALTQNSSGNTERQTFRRRLAQATEIERARYEQLRLWRRQQAHEAGVPPYVILTNRQTLDVALRTGAQGQAGQGRRAGLLLCPRRQPAGALRGPQDTRLQA